METSLNERIRETLLECRICLSSLTKPKSLPQCLHTFCEKCLINYVVHQLEPFSVDIIFPCPICRHDTDLGPIDIEDDVDEQVSEIIVKKSIMSLPNAFFAVSLADLITEDDSDKQKKSVKRNECGVCKYRDEINTTTTTTQATTSCVECKLKLCDQCSLTHRQLDITKHHTLLHDSNNNDEESQSDWSDLLDSSINSIEEFKFCNLCEEEIFAMTHCEQCEVNMCGNCSLIHAESFSSIDHTLSRISASISQDKGTKQSASTQKVASLVHYECSSHKDEYVAYFCVTCTEQLCIACLLCDHKEHITLTLGEAFQMLENQLQPVIDRTREVLYKISEENEHLMAVEQQLELERGAIVASIQRQYEDELERLKENREEILSRVEMFYDTREVRRRQTNVDASIETLLTAGDYYLNEEFDSSRRNLTELQRGMKTVRDLNKSLNEIAELPSQGSTHDDRLTDKMYFTPAPILKHQRVGGLYIARNDAHKIVPTLLVYGVKALPSPYNAIKCREKVLSVCILSEGRDLAVLIRPRKEGDPCVRIYSRNGHLKSQLASDIREPIAMATRGCGRQVAVLSHAHQKDNDAHHALYSDSYCGRVHCLVADTGIYTLSFTTTGNVDIAVDGYNRYVLLDAGQQCLRVHSQTDGHHIKTLDIGEVKRPLSIDICTRRLCVLDEESSNITIYRYNDMMLEFVARIDSSASQFYGGIMAISSDRSNGGQFIAAKSENILRLTTDGRASKVIGINVDGVQNMAADNGELVIVKVRPAQENHIEEENGEAQGQGKVSIDKEEWQILRYRMVDE